MRISLVVAMTPGRVIGKEGRLPWRLPADMRHFRRVTMGHPVIMGRKTFESVGAPLEGRVNIVVTQRRDYVAAGCRVAHSPEEALEHARTAASSGSQVAGGSGVAGETDDAGEVMVIGGASIYAAFLPRAGRLYVTFVHAQIDGDTCFPGIDLGEWREIQREEHPADERNPYAHSFVVFEREAS